LATRQNKTVYIAGRWRQGKGLPIKEKDATRILDAVCNDAAGRERWKVLVAQEFVGGDEARKRLGPAAAKQQKHQKKQRGYVAKNKQKAKERSVRWRRGVGEERGRRRLTFRGGRARRRGKGG
jgi:hypothetical protein